MFIYIAEQRSTGAGSPGDQPWPTDGVAPPLNFSPDDYLDLGRLASSELMNLEESLPDNFWQLLTPSGDAMAQEPPAVSQGSHFAPGKAPA